MKRIAKLAAKLLGSVALLALSASAQHVRAFAYSPEAGVPQTFEFMSAGMAVEGKLVKGAPYSAEASNESIQTLVDGNRIVRRTTTKLYRDSEGRTRREQTLEAIGPWAASGQPRQIIMINDPVAGISITLDPVAKTAHKLPVMRWSTTGGSEVTFEAFAGGAAVAGSGSGTNVIISRSIERHTTSEASPNIDKQDLGKRSFEGIEAQGTRITHTVPAGQMGNERPIEVVSETWYSPDLQLTVASETRDPRMGNTTYRLSNISRAEQPRLLFEVPSDYTLQEAPARPAIRMKKEMM